MSLAVSQIAGPPLHRAAPQLVLLHGFTQNRHCWGEFADLLGERFSVLALDLPGHGDSNFSSATFPETVALMNETVGPQVSVVVGYSMGGRVALNAVIEDPQICQSLVLIGATAGIEDEAERLRRIAADEQLAERLEAEGPARFLDFWLQLPLFDGLSAAQQQRSDRLDHWGAGVADTLRHRGTGSMASLWNRLSEVEVPTLLLVGDRDSKFTEIGSRLQAGIGDSATHQIIDDCGHACHLHQPGVTADAIIRWFDRHAPKP